MTTFRCPYCKQSLGAEPLGRCPHCGKDMVVPGHLRKTTFKERQRMRDKLAREAARQRRAVGSSDFRPGRNPAILGLMILVMVILGGLLVSRLNVSRKLARRPSRELRADKELYALRIALERFRLDTGRYPVPDDEELKALVQNPGVTNWGGHYVNLVKPDPWRTPYHYDLTTTNGATNVVLFSYGPDRRPHTADDLHAQPPTSEEIRRPAAARETDYDMD